MPTEKCAKVNFKVEAIGNVSYGLNKCSAGFFLIAPLC